MYLSASPVLVLKNRVLLETYFTGKTGGTEVKSHAKFPQQVCKGAALPSRLGPAPGSTHLTGDSAAKAPYAGHLGLWGI